MKSLTLSENGIKTDEDFAGRPPYFLFKSIIEATPYTNSYITIVPGAFNQNDSQNCMGFLIL